MTNPNLRVDALSDGVFAIAMTLLILEVKVPPPHDITSTAELWRALSQQAPSVFAFVLSFAVILITWVNHHALLRLVHNTTAAYLYANGLLLFTVISIPFTAGLLGEYVWTDHAAPAVVLYNAVLAILTIGWILVAGAAIRGRLVANEQGAAAMREARRNGFFGFGLYALLAVAALWIPTTVAIVTTLSWLFWLVLGFRLKQV